ncbi:MAG: hypothetical protein AAF664_23005 [Planctomycetota bacterium]
MSQSRGLAEPCRRLAKADMRYTLTLAWVSVIFASGCSSEAPSTAPISAPANVRSTDDVKREPKTIANTSSRRHKAIIVINVAKKGEGGPSCSSDMGAKGRFKCGPEASLTELSWEFSEHRDGLDFYRFSWSLTTNGRLKDRKGFTVGFDGTTETTVIDAEHHIVIREGPLTTRS